MFKGFKAVAKVNHHVPFTNEIYNSLLNEYQILHLIYHRNLNQHRVSTWWKYFNLLHRHVRKILCLMDDIFEVINTRKLTNIKFNKFKRNWVKNYEIPKPKKIKRKKNKAKTKNRNDKSSSNYLFVSQTLNDTKCHNLLNNLINDLLKESHHVYKHLIPPSYYSFMNIIQLGQFVNLGFTLIGLLAKIRSLLESIENVKDYHLIHTDKIQKIIEPVNEIDKDFGEVITTEDLASENLNLDVENTPTVSAIPQNTKENTKKHKIDTKQDSISQELKKSKSKTKSKKKKSKSAKSAMDDIFGF